MKNELEWLQSLEAKFYKEGGYTREDLHSEVTSRIEECTEVTDEMANGLLGRPTTVKILTVDNPDLIRVKYEQDLFNMIADTIRPKGGSK